MAFKLRSQSPLHQEQKPKTFPVGKGTYTGVNLNPNGKSEPVVKKNGKDITKDKKTQQKLLSEKKRNLEEQQDYETTNKPNIYMADPTGTSSWGDAKRAVQHIGLMAQSGDWSGERLLKDGLDIISAVPMGNKVKAAAQGFGLVKKVAASPVGRKAAGKITKKVIATVAPDQASEKISQDSIDGNKKKSESPAKQKEMIKRKDGSYSERGLWDNVRANKGSGKKPTKAMLKEGKKINKKK